MSKLAPTPHRQLLQVALNNVHLLRAQSSPDVLAAVAEVTGIATSTLVVADSQIARTGSLAPLKALLNDPRVPKADSLRYTLELKQGHDGQATPRERIGQRLVLALASARGQVEVEIRIMLQRKRLPGAPTGPAAGERQTARIAVSYRVAVGARQQAFCQEVCVAGDRPLHRGHNAAQAA
jgi:hypothetical protein